MRTDLRPYWVKKAYLRCRDAYIDYSILLKGITERLKLNAKPLISVVTLTLLEDITSLISEKGVYKLPIEAGLLANFIKSKSIFSGLIKGSSP